MLNFLSKIKRYFQLTDSHIADIYKMQKNDHKIDIYLHELEQRMIRIESELFSFEELQKRVTAINKHLNSLSELVEKLSINWVQKGQ
jgi:hypothetical protein